jgi:DNA mismatch repair protein MutS2
MTCSPGDAVHVPGLGKGVVRELRKGGRCLVEIKGRALDVDASRLEPIRSRTPRAAGASAQPEAVEPPRVHVPASIDLHGLRPDDALAALDGFINDAILAGHASVSVIHGRGGGRLKDLVHRRLGSLAAVKHLRVDPVNPGVTIVAL